MSSLKVKLTNEQVALLGGGDHIITPEGNEYRRNNMWHKKTEDPGIYEVFSEDEIPHDLLVQLGEVKGTMLTGEMKVRKVREMIVKILQEHDLAMVGVIHTPGFADSMLHVTPSYSCVRTNAVSGNLEIRSRLNEEYGGDKQRKNFVDMSSANMLNMLSRKALMSCVDLVQMGDVVDKQLGVHHSFGPDKSSNEELN